MSRFHWFAAAAVVSLIGVSACATPTPRYAVVADPLAAEGGSAAPPASEAAMSPEPVAMLEAPPAALEIETPRAAPLGRVETVTLAQLPPPIPAEVQPAPALTPSVQAPGAVVAAPSQAEATLSHVVGPGDTFFAIGRRYGVGPQAIADANGLSFASTLRLGQRIQLPAGARDRGASASAPARLAQAPVASSADAAPQRVTVVEPEAPAVQTPAPVIAPPAATSQPVPLATPPSAAPAYEPPAVTPIVPSASAPTRTPAPTPPPQRAPAVVAAPPPAIVAPSPSPGAVAVNPALAGRGLFVWPLRGDLLGGFGPKSVGKRSDGVNIAAAEGDPVRAAAAGTVVYAGDKVPGGYGKLVLIEHADRWFTVYAHLSDIAVRMRQTVSQNQEIGRAGRTGDVGAPQLYFEVRHAPTAGDRARPVDPLPLLPQ